MNALRLIPMAAPVNRAGRELRKLSPDAFNDSRFDTS